MGRDAVGRPTAIRQRGSGRAARDRLPRLAHAPSAPPADGDAVLATPADYRGESFYSFRWSPMPGLSTHVSRTLDHTLFTTDWNRPVASHLKPDPAVTPAHLAYFPSPAAVPRWDAAKRQQEPAAH